MTFRIYSIDRIIDFAVAPLISGYVGTQTYAPAVDNQQRESEGMDQRAV